jgi:hypothetical protein
VRTKAVLRQEEGSRHTRCAQCKWSATRIAEPARCRRYKCEDEGALGLRLWNGVEDNQARDGDAGFFLLRGVNAMGFRIDSEAVNGMRYANVAKL